MPKSEASILKQLKYSFLGFGLLMGLVFPVYASFFVDWKEGMLLWFCMGCIAAGITIGIVNHKLLEWLLISKLRQVAIASERIRNGDLREGCGIRSADTIGEITEGFDAMAVSLREIVGEIQTIVQAGVQGDFSKKMDLNGKQGFGKDIAAALNQLCTTTEAGLNDVMRVTTHWLRAI